MSKYHGRIGFVKTVEKIEIVDGEPVKTGIWEEKVLERMYYGDILTITSKRNDANKVNDDIDISNKISIVADPYMHQNLKSLRYVEWLGEMWDVSSISVEYPRLVLSIGGVYNGPTPGASC